MPEPDPARDISMPDVPSLRDAFRALTPPGHDPDALMKSLKGSQRPPLNFLAATGDAGPHIAWCKRCERPHDTRVICPEPGDGPSLREASEAMLPADPFTPGAMADAATAEFYHGLVDSGVPVDSVERIIGHMIADLIIARGDGGQGA